MGPCHLCRQPCELGDSYSEPTSWLTLSKASGHGAASVPSLSRCYPYQVPEPAFSLLGAFSAEKLCAPEQKED